MNTDCGAAVSVFETRSYYVVLARLELTYVDKDGLGFTEIHLLLRADSWK